MTQQNEMTDEQAMKLLERRMEHFMQKKGLLHLKEQMVDNLAKFELAMEKEGVTFDQVRRGEVPEQIYNQFVDLERSRAVAVGSFNYNLKKALKTGELPKIDQEFNRYNKIEEAREKSAQRIAELKERQNNHPSKENLAEIIQETMRQKDAVEQARNTEPTGFNAGANALRDKYFREAVEAKKAGREFKKEKGITTPQPYEIDKSNCNEYSHAFDDAVTQAVDAEETNDGQC